MAELSGFEVLGLLNEIETNLRGAYINNIYKMGSSHLIRLRNPESDDVWLVVSPRRGVWPSKGVSEKSETAEFTTRLRQELERAKFVGAHQADLDRVFELEFEGKEKRTLIVELMPPGNIIVAGPDGRVLVSQVEVRTPARSVTRGAPYRPPGQSRISPTDVKAEAITTMAMSEKTAGSAIGRHVALPRKYVSECLARLGLKDGSPSSSLEGRESEVVRALGEMVDEARRSRRPCICETPNGDEIFVVPPKGARVKESAPTIAELCDRLFLREVETEVEPDSPAEIKRKEMVATIAKLRSESAQLRDEAAALREAAARARASPLPQALLILKGAGAKPPRDPSSPDSVASFLFDRAKESEAKASAAMGSAERLEKKTARAPAKAPPRPKLLPRRRQEWYEKFRWFYTSGGKLAIGGRDAQTNSLLINRYLEDDDTVYHADLFGSPFFILKEGKRQSDEEVREVAQATVAFSSAWKTGLGAADSYWVTKDQVKTAAPSGEYLQRGSFGIAGKKNFVTRNIVEAAVGTDDGGRVLVGPEDAVKAHAARYLVLRPQREKGSDTAKRVAKDLAAFSDGAVPSVSIDEVLRMLPTGGGKIIRRSGASPNQEAL